MNQDAVMMKEIILLCLKVNEKAFEIYKIFSKCDYTSPELREFWKEMSFENSKHFEYWERLLEMADMGIIPQLFDDPFKVRQELNDILVQSEVLIPKCNECSEENADLKNIFRLAFSIEYFALNPVFVNLFYFLTSLSEESSTADYYAGHLTKFILCLEKYSTASPELKIIANILKKMWDSTKELASQNVHDILTGVLNRRGLFNAIKPLAFLAKRNQSPVGVMMVDIDYFKNVNDTYGHVKGDSVLKKVAAIMKDNVRGSDIIGRYGGEEFLAFLSPTKVENLFDIGEKIRKAVESGTKDEIPITISIGISMGYITDDIEKKLDYMIQVADDLLYKAKRLGRNRVVCQDS